MRGRDVVGKDVDAGKMIEQLAGLLLAMGYEYLSVMSAMHYCVEFRTDEFRADREHLRDMEAEGGDV